MTRKSKREIESVLDELDDDTRDLGWVDFLRLEEGDAEPADYGLTPAEVTEQWEAFTRETGIAGGEA